MPVPERLLDGGGVDLDAGLPDERERLCVAVGGRARDEPVTEPGFGDEVARPPGFGLELLAHRGEVHP